MDTLIAAVLATPIGIRPTASVVDWGPRDRRQGKRIGRMIVGAMGDVPTGKRIYCDAFGSLPDVAEVRDEVESLVGREIVVYLKARSLGLEHETSMRCVLEEQGLIAAGETAAYLGSIGKPRVT